VTWAEGGLETDIGEGMEGTGTGGEGEDSIIGTGRRDEDWTVVAVDEVDGDVMPTLLALPLLAILRSLRIPGSRPPLLALPFGDSILLRVAFD
jgi:hypothetical protein